MPAGTPNGQVPQTPRFARGPDLSAWQLWWRFNRDPYLNLRERVLDPGTVSPGSDDFFLGQNQEFSESAGLRPDPRVVRERVVPVLLQTLADDESTELANSAMLSLAKIGQAAVGDAADLSQLFVSFLRDGNRETAETAIIAMGVLAEASTSPILAQLVGDSERGRELVGRTEVPYRMRAFAAYGLGLTGNRTTNSDVRRFVVHELYRTLQSDRSAVRDAKVACMIALGLVPVAPLDASANRLFAESADVGRSELSAPSISREKQIAYLLEILRDDDQHRIVRSHAPTALARLLEAGDGSGPESKGAELEAEVTLELLDRIGKFSKESRQVQQSCVIALGQIGDADGDKLDRKIREALMRNCADGDQQARRFATIALAQVAGRPGDGEGHALEGTDEARRFLMRRLARSRGGMRPWTGLALGVLGRGLGEHRQIHSSDAVAAVSKHVADCKSPQEAGAYLIAAGLYRDPKPAKDVLEALARFSDDEVRSEACVALGMIGVDGARESLEDVIGKARHRPELLQSASVGMALLGHKEIVPLLLGELEKCQCLQSQRGVTTALGLVGDARAVEPLLALLEDEGQQKRSRAYAAQALGMLADKEMLPWSSKISRNLNYLANPTTLTSPEGWGILDVF
jgi:HEAT repeat protein